MTTPNPDDRPPRTIDLEIEVPGTPEQVWRAIATGPGISAWMHPCEVEEREGGAFAYDMGSGMRGSGRVTGWDPPRRFAQEEEWSAGEDAAPALLATEWLVEARSGGTCVVRMVMSGFGTGAGWDDEIDGMAEGMRAALENLRIYLTHFPGLTGAWVRAFGTGPADLDERWEALAGALGLDVTAAAGTPVEPDGAPRALRRGRAVARAEVPPRRAAAARRARARHRPRARLRRARLDDVPGLPLRRRRGRARRPRGTGVAGLDGRALPVAGAGVAGLAGR